MKLRNGFVSNSSSSSFICNVCGEIESGYDAGLDDFDMIQCINGHEFHTACIGKDVPDFDDFISKCTKEELIELFNELSKETCDESLTKDELKDEICEIVSDYGVPERFCPICSFSNLNDEDVVNYLYKSTNYTKESLTKEIKSKFSNYKEFKKFLDK
jgi:hypothetical protein